MSPESEPVVAKPVRGIVCITLGMVGLFLGGAILVAIWMYGHRVVASTDQAILRLETRLTEFAATAADTQTGIELTRGVVGKVETEIRTRTREALTPGPELQDRIADLSGRLDEGVGRLRYWMGRVDQGLRVSEEVVEILESQGLWAAGRPDGMDQILSSVSSGRETLAALDEDVLAIQSVLDGLSRGVLPERDESELTKLSQRIDRSLIDLSGVATRFQQSADRLIESLRGYQQSFQKKLVLIQLGATGLLLWQILGQWCLFLVGRRLCNPGGRLKTCTGGMDDV